MSTNPSPGLPDVQQRLAQIDGEVRVVASRTLGNHPPQTLTPRDLTHETFIKLSAAPTAPTTVPNALPNRTGP